MKKELNFVLSFALIALIAVTALTGCYDNDSNVTETQTQSQIVEQTQSRSETQTLEPDVSDDTVLSIGEGETVFRFEVTDDEGKTTVWDIGTDEKTVGAALLETGLIEGEESEYGLYVKVVSGVTADYDTDQSYWAFYVDGDYATAGVDVTNIETDKIYAFVYTKE